MSVAVLAFDPVSPRSGGALLGDRIRMLDAAEHPNVYMRSIAARDPAGSPVLPALLAVLDL
jgi:LAO/AO transport system kinase